MPVEIVCDTCEKRFSVSPSRSNSRFCSRPCYYTAKRDGRIENGPEPLPSPSRPALVEMYWCRDLSVKEIAGKHDVSGSTVYNWLLDKAIDKKNLTMKPSKGELWELYVNQQRTIYAMGDLYGVEGGTVHDWLRSADITSKDRRKEFERRNRPNAEDLYKMVHVQHLSYEEIGEKYGTTHSPVTKWLAKAGVEGGDQWATMNGCVFPETPPRDVLSILYREWRLTQKAVGELYGVCKSTVRKWLRERDVPTRPSGLNVNRAQKCSDGAIVRSLYEKRVVEHLIRQGFEYVYEPYIPGAGYSKSDFKVGDLWIEVWGMSDGRRPKYDEKRRKKEAAYRSKGLALLGLNPNDFDMRHCAYKKKIDRALVEQAGQLSIFM